MDNSIPPLILSFMQSTPNWARLVEEGRCKAIGMPWSEEEVVALYTLKIPIEYVRNGCLTREEYEEEVKKEEEYTKNNGEKPLTSTSRKDLILIARDLGMVVDDSALKPDLVKAIENKRKFLKKQEEKLQKENTTQDNNPPLDGQNL